MAKKIFSNFIKEAKKADTMLIQREGDMIILCSGFWALKIPYLVYEHEMSALPFPHCEENKTIRRTGKNSYFEEIEPMGFDRFFPPVGSADNSMYRKVRITPFKRDLEGSKADVRFLIGDNGKEHTIIGVNDKFLSAFDDFNVFYSTGEPHAPIFSEAGDWQALILPIRLNTENALALLSMMGEVEIEMIIPNVA